MSRIPREHAIYETRGAAWPTRSERQNPTMSYERIPRHERREPSPRRRIIVTASPTTGREAAEQLNRIILEGQAPRHERRPPRHERRESIIVTASPPTGREVADVHMRRDMEQEQSDRINIEGQASSPERRHPSLERRQRSPSPMIIVTASPTRGREAADMHMRRDMEQEQPNRFIGEGQARDVGMMRRY